MKLDQSRLNRQKKAARLWIDGKGRGTVVGTTGFGKSMIAQLIGRFLKNKNRGFPIIIVVPTNYLKEQWEGIVKDEKWSRTQVWVINSLIRSKHKTGLLILDEVHMYSAPTFRKVFTHVEYKFVIGLTATLDEKDAKYNIIRKKCPVVDEITIREARDNGWISDYVIYNLGIELPTTDREAYDVINQKFIRLFAMFRHDLNLARKCMFNKAVREKFSQEMDIPASQIFLLARKLQEYIRKRQTFLYEYRPKLDLAIDICNTFPNRKIIAFSQSIEAANHIHNNMGDTCAVYHSKVKGETVDGKYVGAKRMKQYAVKRFASNDGTVKCHVLSTARALDLGADLPLIDMVIVTSGSSKALQAIQRYGRSLRKVEGKSTIIIEIYVLETQDYKWLKSRQKKVPRTVITHINNINQIEV